MNKVRAARVLTAIFILSLLVTCAFYVQKRVSAQVADPNDTLQLLGNRLIREGDFKDARNTDTAGRLTLYFKNTLGSDVKINNFSIDGVVSTSLPTKCNPFRCTQIPDTRWWFAWPNAVKAGQISTMRIRLVDIPTTLGTTGSSHTITISTDKGDLDYTISPQPAQKLWIPYVNISQTLNSVTVYVGNQGTTALTLPDTGGVKINDASVTTIPVQKILQPGDVVPLKFSLGSALSAGSNVLFSVTSLEGETTIGSMRAIPSSFGTTLWQFNPIMNNEPGLLDHFIDLNIPGSSSFQDEPTGNLIPPVTYTNPPAGVTTSTGLVNRIQSFLSPTSGIAPTSPCMSQLTGYDENLIYGDMCDITMTHGGNSTQDLSLFLSWPKPVWYLPQDAWGRMESNTWQKEYWYRPEDLIKQAFQGVGHGAKDIQWFTHINLWDQGFGAGGGVDWNRIHQSFFMPGVIANPVIYDRMGRTSSVLRVLKPYLTDSAPVSSTVDAQGVEINTLVTGDGQNAVVMLIDEKTDSTYYTETSASKQQTVFNNITVRVKVPAYLPATEAYIIDPFRGVYAAPSFTRVNSTTIDIGIDTLQTGAALVLGSASDGTALTSAFNANKPTLDTYSDTPATTLPFPAAQIKPATWDIPLKTGAGSMQSLDLNNAGDRILIANNTDVFLLDKHSTLIWKKSYLDAVNYAKFSKNNDIVYVATAGSETEYSSFIIAYDLTGTELWRKNSGETVAPSNSTGRSIFKMEPALDDNGVVYTEWNGYIIHLNPQGTVVWSAKPGSYGNWPFYLNPLTDGGAFVSTMNGIDRYNSSGVKQYTQSLDDSRGVGIGSNTSGTISAGGSYNLTIYQGASKTGTVSAGRHIRVVKASVQYVAAGSSDGVFKLVSPTGQTVFQKTDPNTYVTDIEFLPNNAGVVVARESFNYSPNTYWRFRDIYEAFDFSGNSLWRHEGFWRTQPSMGQIDLDSTGRYLAVATNDDVRLVDTQSATVSNSTLSTLALPSPWSYADIGAVGEPGITTYDPLGSSFNLKGAGSDIAGTSDSFHYAYRPFVGDGSIIVRVTDIQRTDSYVKAGIMFRESLDPGAKEASIVAVAPQPNKFYVHTREATGGNTTSFWVTGQSATDLPSWMKLVRTGTNIDAYYSTDGVTWTKACIPNLGYCSYKLSSANQIYVGMVTVSRVTSTGVSVFDNVQVTDANGQSVQPTAIPRISTDLVTDGRINVFDMLELLRNWGAPADSKTDINKDSRVNSFDAGYLMYFHDNTTP